MTTLTLVMGLPFAGKNLYAQNIAGIHVNVEAIRLGSTGTETPQSSTEPLVEQLVQRSVHFHLKNKQSVVVTAPLLTIAERSTLIAMGNKLKVSVEVHWVDTSFSVIIERAMNHSGECGGQTYTVEELNHLAGTLEFPTKQEGMSIIDYVSSDRKQT